MCEAQFVGLSLILMNVLLSFKEILKSVFFPVGLQVSIG